MIKKLSTVVLLFLVLVIFLGLTDPQKLPIVFLLVPVLLVFLIFSLGVNMYLSIFGSKVSTIKNRNISLLIGSLMALMLLFYFSGGLVLQDILIIIAIFIITIVYVNKY